MLKRSQLLLLALFTIRAGHAQQPPAALHFDVVGIKETKPDADGHYRMNYRNDPHNSHVEIQSFDAQALLRYAFFLDGFRIVNFPKALPWALYNLHLSGSEETDAALKAMTDEQSKEAHRQMLQEVLVERFHLRYHWATQDMRSVLMLPDKQSGLHPSAVKPEDANRPESKDDPTAPFVEWQCAAKGCEIHARGKSMVWLADTAMPYIESPVVDQTGLPGLWDFSLRYCQPWVCHMSAAAGPDSENYPPMETALVSELGLKTDHGKAPVRVLVIDHIEPPTPN